MQTRWVTLRRGVPVDVLQCENCGASITEEDWTAPLLPLVEGHCMNCGEERSEGACVSCGLTVEEDTEVHRELRDQVGPQMSLLAASREASRQGRRLMALKLATAAAAFNEEGHGDIARALRVWLLSAIGESLSALEDSKAWVEHTKEPPAVAWASLGQQYQHAGFPGSAADAYGKALAKDQRQHAVRARRAQLLMQMQREGQASEEACLVLEQSNDETAVSVALEVAEKLADHYESQFRDDEIERLLKRAEGHVGRSARLLAHRARLASLEGDVAGARRDLKSARKLNPNLDVYDRVEQAIKPQRTSWWRW